MPVSVTTPAVPNSTRGIPVIKSFSDGVVPYFPERNFLITGVTKDNSGTPLGGCTVKLFNTATDVLSQTIVSDASGNYSFIVDKTQLWYVVAYLAGSPDVEGTTVNTLAGA